MRDPGPDPSDVDAARTALATPIGEAGSGKVRYGAAMTLWRAGLLSPEALEVYRICAMLDNEDPGPILAALPQDDAPARQGSPREARAVVALVDAIDRYLAGLPGPGPSEARQAIAAADRSAVHLRDGAENSVVAQSMHPALVALARTHPGLARAIAGATPHLAWVTYDEYPRAEIGDSFAEGHAFASIIGEGAPLSARDFDLGLFLIAPHVLYRDHCHRAPELYVPLTGPHGWRFGPGTPLVIRPAHVPVWNEPFAPHLTKVGPVPFLCLYAWTRDVAEPARVIPANDWAALEAMRLSDAG